MASPLYSVEASTPNQPPKLVGSGMEGRVGIAEASRLLGISREGVRQRIRRGQLDACKVDGVWWVSIAPEVACPPSSSRVNGAPTIPNWLGPNDGTDRTQQSGDGTPYSLLTTQLEAENTFLKQECERLHELVRSEQETRRREVSELHILLQRAQAQLPMPIPPSTTQEPTTASPQRKRRWWRW